VSCVLLDLLQTKQVLVQRVKVALLANTVKAQKTTTVLLLQTPPFVLIAQLVIHQVRVVEAGRNS
jgi:hypothetical protein